jgi:hypothetical protein
MTSTSWNGKREYRNCCAVDREAISTAAHSNMMSANLKLDENRMASTTNGREVLWKSNALVSEGRI